MTIHTIDTLIGQSYRDAQAAPFGRPSQITWVLKAVWDATDGIPHARLVNEHDRTRQKTVSLRVLSDRRRFIPIGG